MGAQNDSHDKEHKGSHHAPNVKKMQATIGNCQAVPLQNLTIFVVWPPFHRDSFVT